MEVGLYPAVKRFLEGLGYAVKGEVGGCDAVGVREGEPAVVVVAELKLGFTLELVLQGVERLGWADEVWLAVPAARKGRVRDGRVRRLCRLLGFGLLAVGAEAEVLVEAGPYRPRGNAGKRRGLLKEHRARRGTHRRAGRGGCRS